MSLSGLESRGVTIVGVLPQGFPSPSVPSVSLEDIPILFGAALGISLVGPAGSDAALISLARRVHAALPADVALQP